MRQHMMTVPELLRGYEPQVKDPKSMRIAKVLRFVAEKLPKSYVEKKFVARIAFALDRLPADGSEYCGKKLTPLITHAENILRRETGDYIIKQRFQGVRMTCSEQDKADHPWVKARKGIDRAIEKARGVVADIKIDGLNEASRKDIQRFNRHSSLLEEFRAKVPLLPSATEDEKDKGKVKK